MSLTQRSAMDGYIYLSKALMPMALCSMHVRVYQPSTHFGAFSLPVKCVLKIKSHIEEVMP